MDIHVYLWARERKSITWIDGPVFCYSVLIVQEGFRSRSLNWFEDQCNAMKVKVNAWVAIWWTDFGKLDFSCWISSEALIQCILSLLDTTVGACMTLSLRIETAWQSWFVDCPVILCWVNCNQATRRWICSLPLPMEYLDFTKLFSSCTWNDDKEFRH